MSGKTENPGSFDVLKTIFKFIVSPIWFLIEEKTNYTHVSPFLLTNIAFWHCFIVTPWYALYAFPFNNPENPDIAAVFHIITYFIILLTFFTLEFRSIAKVFKPRVQKMNHVTIGLFGMIVSIWIMIGSFLAHSFAFHLIISTFVFIASIILLGVFYIFFSNALTTLYVRLPSENRSFSGFKLYVFSFGLLHLTAAVGTIHLVNIWYIFPFLIAFSFVLCCDAWSCFFTDSFMLCEHRELEFQMKSVEPIDGVIYNVAVRRMYEKSKKTLPEGFQFDDELFVGNEWFNYEHPLVRKSFWV